ncbi:MAG: Stk1 family PASTA domain-containing Ser/Thr kinase [Eubacterium sp.]|nr:Stk1 family PASTA domain-containing Ser/Thr kinase [Eubacterium sp.]
MLKPGTIMDERYEIIDVVGTGGMSTVYRAKDHRLKRFVAVKVLKTEYSNDANFIAKFRVEAQASAGLTHPNIVSVYDVCEDNGRYFIVMELVEGITLKEYINLNGRLSMDQAIDFSVQIASGLEAAHEHHVIHRDIKPQNIIVAKNGNLKVTDFGIAKAATSNTMSTAGMGSVHYISPEQARGGYSDERSDIYSLGITMYEMVTGRVPFEGDTNVAIALMHIQNELIPPRELYPDIYSSFEKIILKATQKKPERRYLTAAALIADLKRVKANPNIDIIVAPATPPNDPTQKFTNQDIQRIKSGAEQRVSGKTSEVMPDRERLNQLINEAEDDDYGYEEEQRPAPPKRQTIKKVADDDDDYEYERPQRRVDDDEENDVDPKLAKAVMIGGIAAAVVIAVIILVVVGNVMGWFKFGSDTDKTSTTAAASTEAGQTETASAEVVREMPSVTGFTQRAAEKTLKDTGFMNIRVETAFDDKIQAEYVISQNHEKGEKLPESTEIVIVVSLGAEEAEVPDVTNYTDQQATTVLKEAGFDVLHAYEFSDEVQKDNVIRTNPEKLQKAPKGSKITLVVSNGKEIKDANVPKLIGISESAARSSLEAVKLSLGNVSHQNSDTEAGLVISQSHPEGTSVPEGTSIDIVISDGPKIVTYKGSVSGSISTSDSEVMDSPESVTVTVYISDSDGDHQVASESADVNSKDSISISGSINGLKYSDGHVKFTVISSSGMDVTQYYRDSLSLSLTPEN